MPTFPRVTPTTSLPAQSPVAAPSPAAFGGLEAQSLARLGGVLTQIGAEREREATRLARTNAVLEHERTFSERIAAWKQAIQGTTDPDLIRQSQTAFFETLDADLDRIEDRVVQQAVKRQVLGDAIAAKVFAGGQVFARELDRRRAAGDAALDLYQRQAIEAPDGPTQAFAEAKLVTTLEALVADGARPAEWAEARRQAAQTTIGRGRARLAIETDPQAALTALEDPDSALSRALPAEDRGVYLGLATTRARQDEDELVRAAAQRLADPLVAEVRAGHFATLEQAQRAAEATTANPAVRDAVSTRLKAAWQDRQTSEAQRLEALARDVSVQLNENGGNLDAIPWPIRRQLTPQHRAALRAEAEAIRKGVPIETDWGLYYDLVQLASADATRETFLTRDLSKDRAKLADAQFTYLTTLQASLRTKDATADAQLEGLQTVHQLTNDALAAVGIDPNPKPGSDDAARVAQFRRARDAAIRAHQRATGKAPTPEDVRGIVENLLLETWERKAFWPDAKRFVFEVGPTEPLYVNPADVPPEERAMIEAALRRRGLPITDAAVVDAYKARLRTLLGQDPEAGR